MKVGCKVLSMQFSSERREMVTDSVQHNWRQWHTLHYSWPFYLLSFFLFFISSKVAISQLRLTAPCLKGRTSVSRENCVMAFQTVWMLSLVCSPVWKIPHESTYYQCKFRFYGRNSLLCNQQGWAWVMALFLGPDQVCRITYFPGQQ